MPRQIQVESMDDALRNSLWNEITEHVDGQYGEWLATSKFMAKYLFKVPVDIVPRNDAHARNWVRDQFFAAPWHQVYDILEFMVQHIDTILREVTTGPYGGRYVDQRHELLRSVDHILERELSGYRFVGGVLSPVTDPVEISAIDAAANHLQGGRLLGPSTHIRTALALLGQKPLPDYRNSIKESISAVESAVNALAGTNGGGVSKAMDVLSTRVEIHAALKSAIKQLYGFTSDADGIRHAILEQSTLGYAEAKFMLVACAAFVNFVLEKGRDGGLT